MNEKISVKPKILELQDTNNIYMTLNICILSNDVNYNNAQFVDDFIEGVINNKDTYIGIPFVVNREKLENADYEDLTHELNDGLLKTDQIGSFIDFWSEEIDGAKCLMGAIKVFKRFPNTCNAILELYNENKLETSCEVLIKDYLEVTSEGIRKIHYNDGKNALIGSAIVTNAAEKRAKPTLLVAEAYQKDIKEQENTAKLTKDKEKKSHEEKLISTIAQSQKEIVEIKSKLEEVKEELKNVGKEKEKTTEINADKVVELQEKINELNNLLVSEKEVKTELENKIVELQEEIKKLLPYKEKLEKAEKEQKMNELNEKYSQLLPKDVFESAEVKEAINSLDSSKLNAIVVQEIAKQKTSENKLNSDDVVVVASKQESLINTNTRERWAKPVSK